MKKYEIDLGRPTFWSDEDRKDWAELFEYIENAEYTIHKSAAYKFVKDLCDKGENYSGNGFKFMFWFDTEEDRKKFIEHCKNRGFSYES